MQYQQPTMRKDAGDSMQQSGQVAVVTKNKYGYGLKIEGNDNWFNTKFDPKCNKGDIVSFDDKDKGYVDGLTVTGAAPAAEAGSGGSAPAGGWDKRQTSIVRQNAVTNANAFITANGSGAKVKTVDDLLAIAKQIEVYTLGTEEVVVSDEDAEQAAALKALADGSA